MMRIQAIFFANARDLAGIGHADIDLPEGALASDLLDLLVDRYPGLLALRSHLRIAVNRRYVTAGARLHSGDEIAVLPPVSGG